MSKVLQHHQPVRLGRYKLIRRIARGVTGTVFLGESDDGRRVAVKVLSRSIAASQRRLMRFYQEAELSLRLAHPHLVPVVEIDSERGWHFLVMKYVECVSLRKHVELRGALGETAALQIALDIASAISALHAAGIYHRDINPDNVLVTPSGRAILADLGLCKNPDDPFDLTLTGGGLGSPAYISPEQFMGAKSVDHRADIYGLGATLYFMLTGEAPFEAGDLVQTLLAKRANRYIPVERRCSGISRSTARLVRTSMAARRSDRLASIQLWRDSAQACCRRQLELAQRRAAGRRPEPVSPADSVSPTYPRLVPAGRPRGLRAWPESLRALPGRVRTAAAGLAERARAWLAVEFPDWMQGKRSAAGPRTRRTLVPQSLGD